MKYFVLPFATAVVVGTLGIATASIATAAVPSRGPNAAKCDNPYAPGYTMGCDQRGAAKKKNALIKHPVKKRHTVAQ
jgi:hypothetical protein